MDMMILPIKTWFLILCHGAQEKEGKREWCDEDEAGIRWYLEHIYDITGKDKILDALAIWEDVTRLTT